MLKWYKNGKVYENRNPHLIPHATNPAVLGVYKESDWDGIIWYLAYYVPNTWKRNITTKKLIASVILERLSYPTKRHGIHGYTPGVLALKRTWNISQATVKNLHLHLIALLKDLGYWKD